VAVKTAEARRLLERLQFCEKELSEVGRQSAEGQAVGLGADVSAGLLAHEKAISHALSLFDALVFCGSYWGSVTNNCAVTVWSVERAATRSDGWYTKQSWQLAQLSRPGSGFGRRLSKQPLKAPHFKGWSSGLSGMRRYD
jgi:hypothetical protein